MFCFFIPKNILINSIKIIVSFSPGGNKQHESLHVDVKMLNQICINSITQSSKSAGFKHSSV